MSAQSAINGQANPAALFLFIRVSKAGEAHLQAQIAAFYAKRHVLTRTAPEAQITTAIAFAKELWNKLHPSGPANFLPMPVIEGNYPLPLSPANVFVHITSQRIDGCYELADALMNGWEGAKVLDERQGFVFRDRRDLIGFIDGIENPVALDERMAATLLDESAGDCAGGSFLLAQRFVHHLNKWQALSVDAQEKVVGRSKWDGAELDDAIKPATAHNVRSNVDIDIVRHNLPYASVGGEKGTIFLGYTNNLAVLDLMLQRMYGLAEDGLVDSLLDFTTAVGGNYFFAPPQDLMESLFDLDDV
ncbi:Dyp-type peroxidase [uncultured Thiothrix sp.]|uniref:Dyp-type peroxidase n=1 Tax=uncultured Thiothrix sp. TaxID=223185 RepID=UPI0026266E81|nr:Dyp-type peroxidase [uncultured Thiothrix sp.]